MRFNLVDNVVTRTLSKICDMVCLNILWLICSIPIVTIGASTAALYTVMLKLVRNEEGYIFKGFFRAFKDNFRQATVIWLILAALGTVWYIDMRVVSVMPETAALLFRTVFLLLGFLLLSVAIYAFPLTARYENTVGTTLKNALILTVAKLPYTLLMVIVTVGAALLSVWNLQFLLIAIPVWLLFGVSLIAWINSYLLRRVFAVFDDKEEKDTKEEVK